MSATETPLRGGMISDDEIAALLAIAERTDDEDLATMCRMALGDPVALDPAQFSAEEIGALNGGLLRDRDRQALERRFGERPFSLEALSDERVSALHAAILAAAEE